MLLHALVIVIVLYGAAPCLAQKAKRHSRSSESSTLSTRQKELLRLQQSIQQRERMIRSLMEKEQATARTVKELEQLLERQRRFIQRLDDEINTVSQRIHRLESERSVMGTALASDADRLRRFILLLARADLDSDDDSGLDTAVLGAALRRLEHRLQTTQRHHDSTTAALDRLQKYRTARQVLLAQQQREQQRLERLLSLRAQLLEKLRRDRRSVERELGELRKSMAAIERTIERLARSKGRASAPSPHTAAPLPSLTPPVRGPIMRRYGEYRHPLTGARAFNAGVDIAVPAGTAVRAAAAGTVVSVQWLPAMNTVVIIDHGGGIRTVYGNLDRAHVRTGDSIRSGQTIGISGESLSGAAVHFELWRGSERLDPTFVVR